MIKVLMVGLFYYFSDARVKEYAEFLGEAGNSVDVLGLHECNTNGILHEKGVRIISVPFPRTRKNRFIYLWEYVSSFLLLGLLVTKLYLKNRYDVIHVHNMPDFLVFCCLIPKLLGARIILDVHDLMPEVYLSKFPERAGGFLWRILCLEEKLSVYFAHVVISANERFAEILVQRGVPASKVVTIRNFPDPRIFNRSKRVAESEKRGGAFTLVFPGTIAPRYGLDVAIRALPLLKDALKHIRLLIVGPQGDYAQELLTLAGRLGVAPFVEFRQMIPNREVPNLLAQADVGIYPALPDCHMSIAIPGKLLEFAIMGLPIISSRLQIVEEMFDDSAVLFFEPGNANQFAERVMQLYNDPALRASLARRADQELAQRLSWERERQAYWALLDRLLPRKRASEKIPRGVDQG